MDYIKSLVKLIKRNIIVVIILIVVLLIIWTWHTISNYIQTNVTEGFGKDSKLTLGYIYINKLTDTDLKIFTVNDKLINASDAKLYVPQIAPAVSDDIIRSPTIDMSASTNLFVVTQPFKKIVDPSNMEQDQMSSYADNSDFGWKNSYKFQFPISFDFKIRIDLPLHSNYMVDLTKPNANITTPNKIIKNQSKSIGLINLGNNSIHIYDVGDIVDSNNISYGSVSKKIDDKNDPTYVTYDINITNLYVNINSIVMYFGPMVLFPGMDLSNNIVKSGLPVIQF